MSEFKAIKISDHVYWVGAIDWQLRDFHGYNTSRGTTYNAFLITGEKNILIDTVKAPFYQEMMARIRSVIEPEKISYIISNHAEMDHSGCLTQTIAAVKPEKVFASKMGVTALQQHLHLDFPLTEIKDQEELTLGDAKFKMLETRMLHWPDSMFTFFANDGILFSQDGFGMHLATTELFVDENDSHVVHYEAAKYYANILLPYSQFVTRLLDKFPSFNLDIKMVAPDHGPIWRKPNDIQEILSLWHLWAEQKRYNKTVVIYDTMWQSTAKMANAIADGLMQNGTNATVMPLGVSHRSDIAIELLQADALLVGTPTLNQQMFPTIADALCYLKGLKRTNLIGQAFGSYGWAGEGVKKVQQELQQMEIELVANPVNIKYVPTSEDLTQCHNLGTEIAQLLTKEQ